MPNEEIKNGITGLGVMAIVFIAAKLIGLLDWSWWAVLIPLYIGPLAAIVAFAAWLVLWFLFEINDAIERWFT
jgi:hypothetical protein